jgi:NAD(P)H dehydrogenase (quinone)
MKSLVVHCHPDPRSFSAALHRTVCDALRRAGGEVRTIDLYAEGFDPVLALDERLAYLDDPAMIERRVQSHVDALRWAEHLVFVHPTWYYGPPAMLKGWLDRVWLPGVAFLPPPAKGRMAMPALRNIRRLTVVTTGGAPWWWLKVIGDPHRKLFTRGLRALLAPGCRTTWLQMHGMNNVTRRDCAAFMQKVSRRLEAAR